MCGIFGVFGSNNASAKRALAYLNRDRGKHATGLVVKDASDERGTYYKASIDIRDVLTCSEYPSDKVRAAKLRSLFDRGSRYFIGHVRAASPAIGKSTDHDAAHPFFYKGSQRSVLGAHNGYVQNFDELKKKYEGYEGVKDFIVDSQIIIFLLAEFGVERLSEIQGKAAVWWVDTDTNYDQVNFWLWDQDFALGKVDGCPAFSSVGWPMELLEGDDSEARNMEDKGNLLYFDHKKEGFFAWTDKDGEVIVVPGKKPVYANRNTARNTTATTGGGAYRGGVNSTHYCSFLFKTDWLNKNIWPGFRVGSDGLELSAFDTFFREVRTKGQALEFENWLTGMCYGWESMEATILNQYLDLAYRYIGTGLFSATATSAIGHYMDELSVERHADDIEMDEPRFSVVKDLSWDDSGLQEIFCFKPREFYKLSDDAIESLDKSSENLYNFHVSSLNEWNDCGRPIKPALANTKYSPTSRNSDICEVFRVAHNEHGYFMYPQSRKADIYKGDRIDVKAIQAADAYITLYGLASKDLLPIIVPSNFKAVACDFFGNVLFKDVFTDEMGFFPVSIEDNEESTLLEHVRSSAYPNLKGVGP